jgi:hypothetical protein
MIIKGSRENGYPRSKGNGGPDGGKLLRPWPGWQECQVKEADRSGRSAKAKGSKSGKLLDFSAFLEYILKLPQGTL